MAFMLDDARAPILLTQSKIAADLPAHQAEVICLDDAELSAVHAHPTSNPDSDATPDDLAYVIYTSGSTGKPKGALVTHHNVARLFDATEHWFGFDERDVWTLFHSYRLRLLGVGAVGRAAVRRPPRRRSLLGEPLAGGVPRAPGARARHRPQPDAVGVPAVDPGRRGQVRRPTSPCAT